jgi:hypothetical protein
MSDSEAVRAARWRANNPDKVRERNAKYYATSKHICVAASERWRKKNWRFISLQMKARKAGLPAPSIGELRALENAKA